MKKQMFGWAAILILVLTVSTAGATVTKVVYPHPVTAPKYIKFTKRLVISPTFKYLRLKRGDSATFSVEISNPTNKDVLISPKIVPSYQENILNSDWITFNKQNFTLKAKGETVLNITVKVPKDAKKGYYYCDIAFTNDTFPVYSPYSIPRYINTMHLSVEVWIPPSVRISPRYINDVVVAGKTYEYVVKIENTANREFTLNPQFEEPEYYWGFATYLNKSNVKIEAPSVIPPKSEVKVKIKVNVPSTAEGYLRGSIDLNINDPGLSDWMNKISLNLNVFTKPAKPFVKTIEIENASKLTVKVSTSIIPSIPLTIPSPSIYHSTNGSMDVKIVSPSGIVKVKPKLIETLIVTTGKTTSPPWEKTEGIYKVVSSSKTKIYTINNPENGVWTIEVMPKKIFGFSMEVDIE
ncbi:MAG: hypothetical protein DSY33_04900 [Archaeoglobus sp.]|nr:MAG: hypothetical protein DSY33_04900 [Archaeoglobus sp.]